MLLMGLMILECHLTKSIFQQNPLECTGYLSRTNKEENIPEIIKSRLNE